MRTKTKFTANNKKKLEKIEIGTDEKGVKIVDAMKKD